MNRYRPDPSLDAVQCSHAALYCFMNAHTFENALLSAVNLGGDADTVGACCGALAGSYWGIDAAPERWTTGTRRQGGSDLRLRMHSGMCAGTSDDLGSRLIMRCS